MAESSTSKSSTSDVPTGRTAEPYVVIARRYRPQAFDELIGQQHVARALGSAIESGRVGHAYLFTGARGVGKTSAARILAKALNCEQGPTPTPCQACDICQSVSGGDDVDVLEIDGASNRGIDEIRQLRQNVNIRPSRARYKIYIIDEVHMLTRDAFNALLKTLEEPPEHVKFIFATTDPNKIPITVLSRCQRFDFAGIDVPAIEQRLAQIAESEGVTADPEALTVLARRAGGSMRDSQSLLEQLLGAGGRSVTLADVTALLGTASSERVATLVERLCERDAAAALGELDAALAEGVEVGQLMEQLLGTYRDVLAAAVGCAPAQFMFSTPSQTEVLQATADKLGVTTTLAIVQILEQTLGRMRASLHARILAELALVQISHLEDLDDLAQVIADLRDQQPAPERSMTQRPAAGRDSKKNEVAAASRSATTSPAFEAQSSSAVATSAPSVAQTGAAVSHVAADITPLTEETVDAVWQQVLGRIEGLVAEHATYVDHVAISAPNRLVASFKSAYNFHKLQCERPEQKALLERALAEVTGDVMRLDFDLAPADEEDQPSSDPPRQPSRREIHAEVGRRPFVRRAMELFDASDFKLNSWNGPS